MMIWWTVNSTVYTIYIVQTALHCLNSSKYVYIHCEGRLARYWNGLMRIEQNVGSLVTWESKGSVISISSDKLVQQHLSTKKSEPLVSLCMPNCVKGWLLAYHRAPSQQARRTRRSEGDGTSVGCQGTAHLMVLLPKTIFVVAIPVLFCSLPSGNNCFSVKKSMFELDCLLESQTVLEFFHLRNKW